MSKLILFFSFVFLLSLMGCGSKSDSGSGLDLSRITVHSSSLVRGDHGVIKTEGSSTGGSAMVAGAEASNPYGASNLYRITNIGQVDYLTFDVVDNETQAVSTVQLEILETKKLSDKYIAAKIADFRVLILGSATGLANCDKPEYLTEADCTLNGGVWTEGSVDVYDISGYDLKTMQIYGTDLYVLNPNIGMILKMDLTQEVLSEAFVSVNNPSGKTVDGREKGTLIFPTSFEIQGARQIGMNGGVAVNAKFLVGNNNIVAAMSSTNPGGGGDLGMVFFDQNTGLAHDTCRNNVFNISGGIQGGTIFYSNDLYLVAIAQTFDTFSTGDKIFKLQFKNGMWDGWCGVGLWGVEATESFVLSPNSTHLGGYYEVIPFKNNYQLTTTERYLLTVNGFYKTGVDAGTLKLSWVNLDLSSLSSIPGTDILVEGDYIYYKSSSNVINRIKLGTVGVGEIKTLTSTFGDIINFSVANNQLFFTTSIGNYLISSDWSEAVIQEMSGTVEGGITF